MMASKYRSSHYVNLLLLGLMATVGLMSPAQAYTVSGDGGLRPDKALLDVKGYSPEVTYHVGRQTLRQEWKPQVQAYRTPTEQFKYNVWHNDWLGTLTEFGAPSFKNP